MRTSDISNRIGHSIFHPVCSSVEEMVPQGKASGLRLRLKGQECFYLICNIFAPYGKVIFLHKFRMLRERWNT